MMALVCVEADSSSVSWLLLLVERGALGIWWSSLLRPLLDLLVPLSSSLLLLSNPCLDVLDELLLIDLKEVARLPCVHYHALVGIAEASETSQLSRQERVLEQRVPVFTLYAVES